MLPLVCSDAHAILYMFDLSRESTLTNVRNWYKQSKEFAPKYAIPFLVGTKFDIFISSSPESQAAVVAKARKYAKAMKASLVFASARIAINVKSLFKVVLAKLFGVVPVIQEIHDAGAPLLEIYKPEEEEAKKHQAPQ